MENQKIFESNFFNVDFFSDTTTTSSKSSTYSLVKPSSPEIDTHIFLINVKTHQGSMAYQYLLNTYGPRPIASLLYKISPFLIDIMCSEYGNYFFQRLVTKLSLEQRLDVLRLISGNFIQICAHKSGTYSIQAVVSAIRTQKEEDMLRILLGRNLVFLFTNENGHHVIQKIIIDYPEERRTYINQCIFDNIDKICVNEYGSLCVIKFINFNMNLLLRVELIKAVNTKFHSLLTNKFGCNIILYMMKKFGNGYSGFVFYEIKQNLVYFSNSKTVSVPLVIKVLNYMNKVFRYNFINFVWEILKDEKSLIALMKSEVGVDIIMAILKNSTREQKDFFKKKNYSEHKFNKSVLLLI